MNLTNNHKLPQFIVDMIERDEREVIPNRYSTTEILKGIKEIILSRRHRDHIVTDATDYLDKLLGTVLHSLFEQNDNNERKEIQLEYRITDLTTLTGRFDRQDGFTLEDYKLTRVNKVIREDFDDYRKQGLIYAWLLRKTGQYIDNLKFYLFLKDYSKTRALTDKNYPKNQLYVWSYKIKIGDMQEIEDFITDKINQIEINSQLNDDDIPACTPDERWFTGDKYAVIKRGSVRASKIFDTESEAIKFIDNKNDYIVEKRSGKNMKCESYCDYKEFCSFYRGIKSNIDYKYNPQEDI